MAKKLSKTIVKKSNKKAVAVVKINPKQKPSSPEKGGSSKKVPKPIPTIREVVEKMNREPLPGKGEVCEESNSHAIVRARAGTGKTFTLIMGVANMFRDHKLQNSYTFRGPRNKVLETAVAGTLWGKVEREAGRWKNDLTGHWEYPQTVKKVVPSKEQQAVWDYMAKEKPRTVCYVAFNNSIVDEFSEKYDWMVALLAEIGVNLTFSTVHSLGNAACKRAYNLRGWKTVNKYRTSDLLSALWEKDLKEVWKEEAENIQAIQELVGLCKQTLNGWGSDMLELETPNEELEAMMDHYGITCTNPAKVYDAVQKLLPQCRQMEQGGRIDFNDMIWLPIVNTLPMVEKYDLVIGDEAQDWNRCQQEIIIRSGRRVIVVGDDRQSIYGFAGADTDSIDRMKGLLGNPKELRLTQTRRCGKAIVELAKQLVPDFEAHPGNCEGKITRVRFDQLEADCTVNPPCRSRMDYECESCRYSLGERDMVLCRVNAPLVGLAFRLIKAGKRANIKGRDIGEGLKAFIKKSKAKDVTSFLDWLDKFYQLEAERIQRRRNIDSEALVTLEDKCTCLRTFASGVVELKEMYAAIDKVFQGKICPQCKKSYDEKQKVCWDDKCKLVNPQGTLLSSVHRAKGMEAKRVFILRPDLMPHPMAKTALDKGQEANIMYVAQTRAIEELVFVDGKFQGKEVSDE